jgi:hypothetical protein
MMKRRFSISCRLHGPTLVIEYDNTQNQANHIHSVWYDPSRDFGAACCAGIMNTDRITQQREASLRCYI